MRGIYIISLDMHDESSGVVKKVNNQIKCMRNHGIDVKLMDGSMVKNNRLLNKIFILLPRIPNKYSIMNRIYKKVVTEVNLKDIDFIYIRKGLIDLEQIRLISKVKEENPKIIILMEVPTFPYDQEYSGIKRLTVLNKDRIARDKLSTLVDRIVTYSDDRHIFGIPTIRISNGVSYDNITPRKVKKTNEIHIIAVALFAHWHGYDRFIEGMKEYYSKPYKRKIILHLVGDGPELSSYKKLVKKYKLNKYVVFHGKLFGAKLDEIYNQCDIALDALARHRSNVFFNSSLKGKEYCAKGIPIISGVKTELDNFRDFPYYLRVSSDDTPINMRKVLEFYDNIYKNGVSKEYITDSIIKLTKSKFDISNVFMPVINYIEGQVRARYEKN